MPSLDQQIIFGRINELLTKFYQNAIINEENYTSIYCLLGGEKVKNGGLQKRMIIGTIVALSFIALSIAGFAVFSTKTFLEKNARQDVEQRYQSINRMIEMYETNAQSHAKSLAQHPLLIEAAKNRNAQALFSIATPLMKDGQLDYLAITDAQGFVIIRVHEPGKIPDPNDNIAGQPNVAQALQGQSFVGVEDGKNVKLTIRSGAPLYDSSGVLVGTISTGYVLSKDEMVDKAKNMLGAEFTFFLGNERVSTTLVDANGKRMVGTALNNAAIEQAVLKEGKTFHGSNRIGQTNYTVVYGPLIDANDKIIGLIFTGVPNTTIESTIFGLSFRIFTMSLVVFILTIIAAIMFTRRITQPLQLIVEKVQEVAKGNVGITQLDIQSNDEIGKLATAFNTMLGNLRGLITQTDQSAEQVAASSQHLTATASQMATAAGEIATATTQVAQGAEKQARSVDDTKQVVQQMSTNIEKMAKNADGVAATSDKTAVAAQEGTVAIDAATNQMGIIEKTVEHSAQVVMKLGERSQEIGQIIDTISGIAGQTNLLALNAAIEAARAGEQGRGFAVVAEEVRKLAEQSQQATQQIAELIGEIQEETKRAVGAMAEGTREVKVGTDVVSKAGQSFGDIVVLVRDVSEQVRAISVALMQMSADSQQIVTSVKEIENISNDAANQTQTVSATTQEQSAAMEEVAASSQTLAKMAEELQSILRKFTV